MSKQLLTPAVWFDDCQGKKDFDGNIIQLSTRYWPGTYQRNLKPSAHASIHIQYGEVDEEGYNGDTLDLIEERFEGDTEAIVKGAVEVWAQTQMNRIVNCLAKEFSVEL